MADYKVIVMCGSTKFKEDFMIWARKLTLGGYIVHMPTIFSKAEEGTDLTPTQTAMLNDMHVQEINRCDAIFVVNKGLYIDEDTKAEIEHAYENNKPVFYMETDPENVKFMAVEPNPVGLL